MKLTFLGTCSGTEPMPGRHHNAFVLEIGGTNYWFDAGENCSHAAYTSGIDLSRVRAVFLSHMHIDHTGGLANLIFTIYKIVERTKKPHINDGCYDIFAPDLELLSSIMAVATAYTPQNAIGVRATGHEVKDGTVYEDENVRVTALHNTHLGEDGTNGWHSYSYLIEAEGKRIVFSGDVKSPLELDPFVEGGCDLLIMETGHHSVESVCSYAQERGIRKFFFTHHGREILRDPRGTEAQLRQKATGGHVCEDGESFVI